MALRFTNVSPNTYARLAGVLYLIVISCALFSEVYVRSSIIVRGDPAATASNIVASAVLFRAGFVADIVAFLSDVILAVVFYILLRPVSKTLALVAAALRLTGSAIYAVNLLNYFAALLILSGTGYLTVFEPSQRQALALLFLDIHKHGYDLGLVFFGLHCMVLGYLLFRSDYFPHILGILMVAGSLAYLSGSFTLFLLPQYAATVAPIYITPLVAELSLCVWLLVKGVRIQENRTNRDL